MANETPAENEDLIIAAAVNLASARHREGGDFAFEVLQSASQVMRFFRDDSDVRKMLRSYRLRGTVTAARFEESSTRIVVSFVADGADGTEELRTFRTDNPSGESIKAMVKRCIGRECVVMKYNDAMSGQQGRTVRVSPYMFPIDRQRD